MADNEKDVSESKKSDVEKELRQTAEKEVAKAVSGAIANLPISDEQSDVKQQSAFFDKHQEPAEEEEVEYVEPMPDPYGKAIKYLEQHNIMQLFQQLTASIVYNKPEKPLEFMMSEVEKFKKEQEKGGNN